MTRQATCSTGQARGSAVLTQVTYIYDASGNLLRETNKAGEVTIRAYSAQNQLLSETRYLAGTTNFSTAEPRSQGRYARVTSTTARIDCAMSSMPKAA